jgi:hypothetical protein
VSQCATCHHNALKKSENSNLFSRHITEDTSCLVAATAR